VNDFANKAIPEGTVKNKQIKNRWWTKSRFNDIEPKLLNCISNWKLGIG